MSTAHILNKGVAEKLINNMKTFFFDCDGEILFVSIRYLISYLVVVKKIKYGKEKLLVYMILFLKNSWYSVLCL